MVLYQGPVGWRRSSARTCDGRTWKLVTQDARLLPAAAAQSVLGPGVYTLNRFWTRPLSGASALSTGRHWGMAKLVRRPTLDRVTVGSNPTSPAIFLFRDRHCWRVAQR